MEIVFSDFAKSRIKNLFVDLYDVKYFSFPENAVAYVNRLIDFIYEIDGITHYKKNNPKAGKFYIKYKTPGGRFWIVVFDKEPNRYVIQDVFNDKSHEYSKLRRKLK
jgi:hypothetical protein